MTKTTSHKNSKNSGSLSHKPPFPTQAEILRVIVNALGTKVATQLKDYVSECAIKGDSDYQKLSEMIESTIFKPIKSLTCESFTEFLRLEVDHFFNSYLGLVKLVALDRLTRQEAFPLLVEHYFSVRAAGFLANFQTQSNGFNPIQFVGNDKTAIEAVFSWLNENENGWDSNCIKEDKDKYANWRKGNHLPDLQSIKLIRENLNLSPENITLLLIARAVDSFRDSDIGKKGIYYTKKQLPFGFIEYEQGEPLSLAQIEANKKLPLSMKALDDCSGILLSSSDCSEITKEIAYECIENLKDSFKKENADERMAHLINWCEARWHVKAGKVKDAAKLYKLAFEQSLYSAGQVQEMIFKDALKVAAKARDIAFLKQLKNHGVAFDYFIAPLEEDVLDLEVNNKKSRSTSNIVEEWEIEKWSNEFDLAFPDKSMFKNANLYKTCKKSGILVFEEIDDIKPHYYDPHKKIFSRNETRKLGSWKKAYPQLVLFTLLNKVEIISKLLDQGDDVNIFSESGETPLLIAIQNMNPYESKTLKNAPSNCPKCPSFIIMTGEENIMLGSVNKNSLNRISGFDNSCYNLITSFPHNRDTLNRRTTKMKLLALICAVDTGRLEVVEKLLDMGADIDRRGTTDEQTALNHCLKNIASLTISPDKSYFLQKNQESMPTPPAVLEIARRQRYSQSGITHKDMQAIMDTGKDEVRFLKQRNEMNKQREILIQTSVKVESMREIASILIKRGANPSAEHITIPMDKRSSPITEYTPLMLAAELDEVDLFEAMIIAKGDKILDKVCKNPYTGKNMNCFQIAVDCNASKVVELLRNNRYGNHFFKANIH